MVPGSGAEVEVGVAPHAVAAAGGVFCAGGVAVTGDGGGGSFAGRGPPFPLMSERSIGEGG